MAHGDIHDMLLNRLAAFRSSGDLGLILDGQVTEEIAALRRAIGWPLFGQPPAGQAFRRELDAVVLAGTFQLIRSRELPESDRVDALLEAVELFTAVYSQAPGLVPEPLRAMCGALAGNPPDMHHAALHNEAIDILDAAEVTRDLAAVDQAIWLIAAAFLAARDDQDRARHLSVLGTGWRERFSITGRAADLDNSVTAHRRALAVPVTDAADQAGHQANLSAALLARYENTGNVPDLEEAVAVARAAADIARVGREQRRPGWPVEADQGLQRRPGWPVEADQGPQRLFGWPGEAGQDRRLAVRRAAQTSLSGLATALLRRYLYRRAEADLDEAVAAGREAVAAAPAGDPARSGLQANLANLLLERFTRQWRLADLSDAVANAQAAVDLAKAGDPARAVGLSALALAHADHFAYSGDLRDLGQAISVGREAVAATGDGHPGAGTCLSNLGGALRTRYERTGDTRALDEAIIVLRQAVHAVPEGHTSLPGFLNNLGNALRSQFDASDTAAGAAAIQESVTVLTKAVAAAHRGGPDRAAYAANLANSLILAAERDAYPGAVDQAISILDQEIGAVGDDHPLRHTYLVSLGHAWLARFDASGDDRALDVAIGHLGQAVQAIPGEHPHRAEYLARLGGALRRKAERSADLDRAAARDAITASRSAAGISTAPAAIRALAARDWGQVAAATGNAAEALQGLSAAVSLLDRVAWRGLQRPDQERNLRRFSALACDAAAWAIAAGQPEHAVELLEQGRGILLTQSLNQRARQHDLHRANPGLAGRLASIDDDLERLPSVDDRLRADDVFAARRRQDLTRERDTVLAQIRGLPGFTDFLRPPAFSALKDAAAQGPVVIVNISAYRCDALTVTTGGVRVTELTGLTGAGVVTHVTAFLVALRSLQNREAGPAGLLDASKTITATLAWLWETIASPLLPVLQAACDAPDGPRPRIWWCPTGPLTFVPLHAAGHHGDTGDSVLDHFVSSYTPTLRLLNRARRQPFRATDHGKPLIVALSQTQGQSELPNADVEADDFVRQFSDARDLRGDRATVTAVKLALGTSPWLAHFACHGMQDIVDPSTAHLRLHDGSLGITEITKLRLDSAELAFLSACETSTGGIQLSDEAITLATAFRLAGYRHVIATLWTISDTHAPEVARHVYQQLKAPTTTPTTPTTLGTAATAAAVDTAILALRRARRSNPWLWASYIHIGP